MYTVLTAFVLANACSLLQLLLQLVSLLLCVQSCHLCLRLGLSPRCREPDVSLFAPPAAICSGTKGVRGSVTRAGQHATCHADFYSLPGTLLGRASPGISSTELTWDHIPTQGMILFHQVSRTRRWQKRDLPCGCSPSSVQPS